MSHVCIKSKELTGVPVVVVVLVVFTLLSLLLFLCRCLLAECCNFVFAVIVVVVFVVDVFVIDLIKKNGDQDGSGGRAQLRSALLARRVGAQQPRTLSGCRCLDISVKLYDDDDADTGDDDNDWKGGRGRPAEI